MCARSLGEIGVTRPSRDADLTFRPALKFRRHVPNHPSMEGSAASVSLRFPLELGAVVLKRRDLVIERMLAVASHGTARRTLGYELLASCFIDRFADSLAAGTFDPLFAWLRAAGEAEGDAGQIRSVLAAGCEAISASYTDETGDPSLHRALAELGRRIASAICGPSVAAAPAATRRPSPKDEAIAEIMAAMDERDRFTSEHSRGVAAWCKRIAQTLGFAPDHVSYIAECGLLHDIGKTVTPHGILYKAGRLNDAEWGIMQLHPAMGARILEHVAPLRHFAPEVRAHHERWDGEGYPDRIAGERIPLAARIVAVADSFHAMVSDRPYRRALRPAVALGELERCRGTQFDPQAVDAMLQIFASRKLRSA